MDLEWGLESLDGMHVDVFVCGQLQEGGSVSVCVCACVCDGGVREVAFG